VAPRGGPAAARQPAVKFTVLGAGGFIGRHLAAHLRGEGHDVLALGRNDTVPDDPLGHVVYCIGLTGDFRGRPFDTAQAHVTRLSAILERAHFESLLYLSSTRVYARASTTCEAAAIPTVPADPSDFYNLSKLMGEALCLACPGKPARIVRLSNVVGFDRQPANFLSALIVDALRGRIELHSAPASEKDYIAIADVVQMLPRIATQGRAQIYNLATGRNVPTSDITARLQALTGCAVTVRPEAPVRRFPAIRVDRLLEEFGFAPRDAFAALPELVEAYRQHPASGSTVA
jgi:nucleoside-diphosphate-sugar epimerase